jgi:hypothetical protein
VRPRAEGDRLHTAFLRLCPGWQMALHRFGSEVTRYGIAAMVHVR